MYRLFCIVCLVAAVSFHADGRESNKSLSTKANKFERTKNSSARSKLISYCNGGDDISLQLPMEPCQMTFGPFDGTNATTSASSLLYLSTQFAGDVLTIDSVNLSGGSGIYIYYDGCTGKTIQGGPNDPQWQCFFNLGLDYPNTTAGKKAATLTFTYHGSLHNSVTGTVDPVSGTSPPVTITTTVLKSPFQADSCFGGSIIRSSTQVLGEVIPVVGADFYLSYSSMFSANYVSSDYAVGRKNFFTPEGWNISIVHYYDQVAQKLYTGDGRVEQHESQSSGTGDLQVVSSDGNEVYVFDSVDGKIKKTLTSITGSTKYTFNYNSSGYLTSIVDAYGNQTIFNRNSSGQLTSIVSPYGQTTSVTEDASGLLASVGNPNGETYFMTYKSGTSLLNTFTKPGSQVSTFSYDSNGRLTQDLSNGGNYWNLVQGVDSSGHPTVTIASKLGRSTVLDIYAPKEMHETKPNGLFNTHVEGLTTVSDSNAQSTNTRAMISDERFGELYQRPAYSNLAIGSSTTTTSYGQSVTYPTGVTPDFFNYSTLTRTETFAGNVSTTVFDMSTKAQTRTSAAGAIDSVTLNMNEKPIQTQVGTDTPVTIAYDTNGRLSQTNQGTHKTTTYGYNSSGYLSSITNARNETTSYGYDLAGRRSSITLPDTRNILFTYDANGNLTSITPPNSQTHGFVFNTFELMGTYQPPSIGSGVSKDTTYSYNDDKQLTLVTRPDGRTIAYNYNATTGELASVVTDEGNYGYTYDPTTKLLSQLDSPHNVSDVFSYQGALLTQDLQRQTSTGTTFGRIAFGYDSNLRLSSRSVYSSGTAITRNYSYNADSKYSQVGDLSLTYEYPSGRLSTTTIDNISDSRIYDAYGDLVGYSATYSPSSGSPSVLYAYTLTRDIAGRISSKTEIIAGVTTVYDYTYDTSGRLTQVKMNGNIESSYTYDNNGNRTSGTINGAAFTATYDNQDRILTFNNKSYTYSTNGDLTRISNPPLNDEVFDYGVKGNLHLVTVPTGGQYDYLNDGYERRVGRRLNGTNQWTRVFADNRIEGEYSGGVLQKEYVHATGDLAADYMISGSNKYRLIKDHLGSVRLVVNTSTGVVVQRLDYNEWGKVLRDTNSCFQPFGYAGGTYDEQTNLVLFGARDYDPETGRWTSKDPIRFNGGDTNLYGYVLNDPINLIDPSGKLSEGFIGSITTPGQQAAIGAVMSAAGAALTSAGYYSGNLGAIGAGVCLSYEGGKNLINANQRGAFDLNKLFNIDQ